MVVLAACTTLLAARQARSTPFVQVNTCVLHLQDSLQDALQLDGKAKMLRSGWENLDLAGGGGGAKAAEIFRHVGSLQRLGCSVGAAASGGPPRQPAPLQACETVRHLGLLQGVCNAGTSVVGCTVR